MKMFHAFVAVALHAWSGEVAKTKSSSLGYIWAVGSRS